MNEKLYFTLKSLNLLENSLLNVQLFSFPNINNSQNTNHIQDNLLKLITYLKGHVECYKKVKHNESQVIVLFSSSLNITTLIDKFTIKQYNIYKIEKKTVVELIEKPLQYKKAFFINMTDFLYIISVIVTSQKSLLKHCFCLLNSNQSIKPIDKSSLSILSNNSSSNPKVLSRILLIKKDGINDIFNKYLKNKEEKINAEGFIFTPYDFSEERKTVEIINYKESIKQGKIIKYKETFSKSELNKPKYFGFTPLRLSCFFSYHDIDKHNEISKKEYYKYHSNSSNNNIPNIVNLSIKVPKIELNCHFCKCKFTDYEEHMINKEHLRITESYNSYYSTFSNIAKRVNAKWVSKNKPLNYNSNNYQNSESLFTTKIETIDIGIDNYECSKKKNINREDCVLSKKSERSKRSYKINEIIHIAEVKDKKLHIQINTTTLNNLHNLKRKLAINFDNIKNKLNRIQQLINKLN